MAKQKRKNPILGARFSSFEELKRFEKHMEQRGIKNLADFIKESVRLYEEEEDEKDKSFDRIMEELRILNSKISFTEKKVDIAGELSLIGVERTNSLMNALSHSGTVEPRKTEPDETLRNDMKEKYDTHGFFTEYLAQGDDRLIKK